MTYLPPGPRRERILLVGVYGTGKSEAVLSIAKRVAPAHMFVVDTEDAYVALVTDETNIEVMPVWSDDWAGMMAALTDAKARGTADSWLVLDSASSPWEAVQNYALDEAWKDEKGGLDWVRINREYARLTRTLMSFPGHVLITSRAKDLGKQETKQTTSAFGEYNVKPAGQKDLGHVIPHTVLLLEKNRVGEFLMTTMKDRKRVEVNKQQVRDFARDYLLKIAGWTNDAVKTDAEVLA